MKRLLVIDTDTSALDICMRAQQYGWSVMWYDKQHKNGDWPKAGEGIVPKLRDYDALWSKWLGWADLVYVPMNDFYIERLEPYRQMGYPIYGCNVAGARWEIDRAEGQRVMKKAGLNIIEGREFHDYESAISFVRKAGKPLVSKPSGEADKALSYVADSAADLIYMLEKWKKNPKFVSSAREHGFILQDKKVGCEFGAAGWFGPGGWAAYWEENAEFKKLMNGDLGVNTGEQGTLLRFVRKSKLADMVVKPLEKQLREIGYVGCVDVNCIIDDEGTPWPLEFTMRDGWPATHNQMSLHEGDPVQWMLDLLNGKDTRKVRYDDVSISVVISGGDYPFSHLTAKEIEGIPIYLNGAEFKNVHLSQVMLGEAPCQADEKVVEMPCYLTAGDYVLIVTGCGETITGARRSAYSTAKKIKMPGNLMMRTDIGKAKFVEALPRIQRHGYAPGLAF